MNEHTDPKIVMSIDPKKYRLRIHKQTLKLLGDPEFVQLLISPAEGAIIVQGRSERETGGQEIPVTFDKPGPSGTFEIYSMELINRIRRHFPALDRERLTRLTGRFMNEDACVCFPLSTQEPSEEAHDI